ncbi:MAG: MoxR family ATPase [Planctomycetia bacterium]|nr:MoxR family ATPase [Planctomycetia bacterium]
MMNDTESIHKIHSMYHQLLEQAATRIVGQSAVLEELVIALFSGGHCLLEGVPGLGKTLIIRTLAQALSLEFQRIQCTPDLMPADITGSEMFQLPGQISREISTQNSDYSISTSVSASVSTSASVSGGMQFMKGPVFTNILLADEINRTPPRTQSALLEAMEERQVTCGRRRFALPEPFMVLATQNSIEQEGTYPLPEAQLDRFMFKSHVTYPTRNEELDILLRATTEICEPKPILTVEELRLARELVRRVPVSTPVVSYALDLCRATRPEMGQDSEMMTDSGRVSEKFPEKRKNADLEAYIREYVAWGAGPRAGLALLQGARARAILHGRFCVDREDVRALAPSVLRHRIQTRFTADAEGITTDGIITRILNAEGFSF